MGRTALRRRRAGRGARLSGQRSLKEVAAPSCPPRRAVIDEVAVTAWNSAFPGCCPVADVADHANGRILATVAPGFHAPPRTAAPGSDALMPPLWAPGTAVRLRPDYGDDKGCTDDAESTKGPAGQSSRRGLVRVRSGGPPLRDRLVAVAAPPKFATNCRRSVDRGPGDDSIAQRHRSGPDRQSVVPTPDPGTQFGEDTAIDGLVPVRSGGRRVDVEIAIAGNDDIRLGRRERCSSHEVVPIHRALRTNGMRARRLRRVAHHRPSARFRQTRTVAVVGHARVFVVMPFRLRGIGLAHFGPVAIDTRSDSIVRVDG